MRLTELPFARSLNHSTLFCLFVIATAGSVWAQTWQPIRGEGSVSVMYQYTQGGNHFDLLGKVDNLGPIRSHGTLVRVEYGITDRVAVSAEVPFIVSKFTLPEGRHEGPHDHHSRVDDGNYHGTVQDFRGRIRYNAVQTPVTLTPFFEIVLPTHGYETFGHSAPGKHLREFRVGTNISSSVDPISSRVYFDLRPVYSFVQSLQNLNLDRVDLDLEVGYNLELFSIRAFGGAEKTLGGIQLPVRDPASEFFENHDRVGRAAYSYAGGGTTVHLRRNMDLIVGYVATLNAKNAHGFSTTAVGVKWFFQTRRSKNSLQF